MTEMSHRISAALRRMASESPMRPFTVLVPAWLRRELRRTKTAHLSPMRRAYHRKRRGWR